MKRQVAEVLAVCCVLLAAFAALMLPVAVRLSFYDTFPGSISHYHAQAAEALASDSRIDEGTFETRTFSYTPYHYLLSYASARIGMKAASFALPLALGLLAAVAFFDFSRRLGFSLRRSLLSSALLLVSPAFLHNFTHSDTSALGAVLFIAALALSFRKSRLAAVLSFVSLLAMSYLGPFNAALAAFVVIYFAATERRVLPFALLLAASIPYYLLYYSQHALSLSGLGIGALLSDLGGYGLGFFNIMLIVIGGCILWKDRDDFSSLYLLLIFLAVGSLFAAAGVLYLTFIGAVFSTEAVAWLSARRWEVELLKNLTLITIVCGLTFSTVSYLQRNLSSEPSLYLSEALVKLKPLPEGYVLSSQENGFWIEYLAEKPVLQDPKSHSSKVAADVETLFSSRNLPRAKSLLANYSVRYILIDRKMRDTVFSRREGLVFLLRNNETFKSVFSNQETDVWEVLR